MRNKEIYSDLIVRYKDALGEIKIMRNTIMRNKVSVMIYRHIVVNYAT